MPVLASAAIQAYSLEEFITEYGGIIPSMLLHPRASDRHVQLMKEICSESVSQDGQQTARSTCCCV